MRKAAQLYGLASILLTGLVFKVFVLVPEVADKLYSRGIYRLLRVIYDATLAHLPFASVYLALPLIVWWLYRAGRKTAEDHHIMTRGIAVFNRFCWLIALFYLLWGYNYALPGVAQRLQLDLASSRQDSSLVVEVRRATSLMIQARELLSVDTAALGVEVLPDKLEGQVRYHLERILVKHGYPVAGSPRVRVLKPAGILLRISTAGVYMPYAMEGHIDAGLHPLQYAYTMAHEMSHGYGVTDEGECNFLALLACMDSTDPYLRYSALRVYWQYLINNLYAIDRSQYAIVMDSIPPSIINDRAAISAQMDVYPDILPAVRNAVYDTYLKTNGVQSGLQSYGQVVTLALAYQQRYGLID